MANGIELGRQNIAAFDAWVATQTSEDFKQIIWRGQLKRSEIAKSIGCGKSALIQNPELKKRLASLEDDLRKASILPPFTEKGSAAKGSPKHYDTNARRQDIDKKRVGNLEQENLELKAKVTELERKLRRLGELSETLAEMGFMPR